MASSFSRKLEDLELSRDEIDKLGNALKNEEFRKLLNEYVEEIKDPENRKTYQNEITQLELERGVNCKFINPEPGFVVKSSVDGKQKAFINICENGLIQKPTSTPMVQGNTRGLNWSLPFSQSSSREDYDKKKSICMVYDVVFHPDTLHLAKKNNEFRKMVVETALNAVEDSFKVKLDKSNITFPKLKYKGFPHASVIRTKSTKPCSMTEEELEEFDNKFGYPFTQINKDKQPEVKQYKTDNIDKYTTPVYTIKYSSDIDLREFTYDKNAKLNSTIPKYIIVDVKLPLLSSSKDVTLDVIEKSLHLICELPAKYKLDLQLPYQVVEECGNAKFDSCTRNLSIQLPVKRKDICEFVREDSGVESDFGDKASSSDDASPLGSMEPDTQFRTKNDCVEVMSEVTSDEFIEDDLKSEQKEYFLNPSYHYSLPDHTLNIQDNILVFILNVKNCDPDSLQQKFFNNSVFHLKFTSVGSGYFPIYYAFYLKFDELKIEEEQFSVEVWDNNVIVQINLEQKQGMLTKYYVGTDEDCLNEHKLATSVNLAQMLSKINLEERDDDEVAIRVCNVTEDEVSFEIMRKTEEENEIMKQDEDDESDDESEVQNTSLQGVKQRTLSEGGEGLEPAIRKSILKKRICRSLSESNADDYALCSSFDGISLFDSDSRIYEEEENKHSKKTVRFSDNIKRQTFRANSCILRQKKKNQKRSKNKKRSLTRRASESENSESEERERQTKQPVVQNDKTVVMTTNTTSSATYQFKSDLIFDLDL